MSAQIRQERNAYYDILEAHAEGRPRHHARGWNGFSAASTAPSTARETRSRSCPAQGALLGSDAQAQPLNDRQRDVLNRLLDGFEGKLTTSKWAKLAKCSQDTALRDINDLVDRGILAEDAGGGRSTSYSLAKVE